MKMGSLLVGNCIAILIPGGSWLAAPSIDAAYQVIQISSNKIVFKFVHSRPAALDAIDRMVYPSVASVSFAVEPTDGPALFYGFSSALALVIKDSTYHFSVPLVPCIFARETVAMSLEPSSLPSLTTPAPTFMRGGAAFEKGRVNIEAIRVACGSNMLRANYLLNDCETTFLEAQVPIKARVLIEAVNQKDLQYVVSTELLLSWITGNFSSVKSNGTISLMNIVPGLSKCSVEDVYGGCEKFYDVYTHVMGFNPLADRSVPSLLF